MSNPTVDKLSRIESRINKPDLIAGGGTANEIGYYIFDYNPQDELLVRETISHLAEKYEIGKTHFSIKVFDLFEIMLQFLKERGYLEKCYSFEEKRGFSYVSEAIAKALRFSQDNVLIEHIVRNTPKNAIVFLTGVGKCFPIIRSHHIINNLQQAMDNIPVILFYPGKYENFSLKLFGTLSDGNHYRALPLIV